jgi:hypothetical protein
MPLRAEGGALPAQMRLRLNIGFVPAVRTDKNFLAAGNRVRYAHQKERYLARPASAPNYAALECTPITLI